jgi:hypothetical protein
VFALKPADSGWLNTNNWKGTEMKTMAKMTVLLIVLGLCLPSYGEILVYKITSKGNEFKQREAGWDARNQPETSYIVLNVNYDDYTITQAEVMNYWKDRDGKWFDRGSVELELVRVTYGNKVQWVIMAKETDLNEAQELVGAGFVMLVGAARNRNIGTENAREVASSLSGYSLWDRIEEDGWRRIEMPKDSVTLHASWTSWANADDENKGHQDFTATTGMIANYLIAKGYTEKNE